MGMDATSQATLDSFFAGAGGAVEMTMAGSGVAQMVHANLGAVSDHVAWNMPMDVAPNMSALGQALSFNEMFMGDGIDLGALASDPGQAGPKVAGPDPVAAARRSISTPKLS